MMWLTVLSPVLKCCISIVSTVCFQIMTEMKVLSNLLIKENVQIYFLKLILKFTYIDT